MRKFLLIILATFGYVGVGVSQASLTEIKRNIYQNLNSSVNQNYIRLINEGMTEDVTNKYYAYEDWTRIKVESVEGDIVEIDSANYHIHDDIILFINDGEMFILFPDQIDRVYANNDTYVTYKNDENEYGYYSILTEGKFQLLKKHYVKKEKVNNHPMGITGGGPQEYKYRKKYKYFYFDVLRDRLLPVPRKKKDLIKIFSRNKSKMINYARDNKLNSKSEGDLISLFSYYNQL